MQPKPTKLLIASLLIACTMLWLGFVVTKDYSRKTDDARFEPALSGAIEFETVYGMGANLMTPRSPVADDDLLDYISAELNRKDANFAGRRCISVLVAGEECKLYVDEGDGNWVPYDDTANSGEFIVDDQHFGEATSDLDPFK